MKKSDLFVVLWFAIPYGVLCLIFGQFEKSDFMYSSGLFFGGLAGMWHERCKK